MKGGYCIYHLIGQGVSHCRQLGVVTLWKVLWETKEKCKVGVEVGARVSSEEVEQKQKDQASGRTEGTDRCFINASSKYLTDTDRTRRTKVLFCFLLSQQYPFQQLTTCLVRNRVQLWLNARGLGSPNLAEL